MMGGCGKCRRRARPAAMSLAHRSSRPPPMGTSRPARPGATPTPCGDPTRAAGFADASCSISGPEPGDAPLHQTDRPIPARALAVCPARRRCTKVAAVPHRAAPVVIHDAGGVSLAPISRTTRQSPTRGTAPAAHHARADARARDLSCRLPTRRPRAPAAKSHARSAEGRPRAALLHRGRRRALPGMVTDQCQTLTQMGAYGIVTSVHSAERLRFMVDTLQIPLAPISADSLFEALGFAVWPVLVGPDGSISQ